MMENIEQMRKRHEAETETLEKGCLHKKLSKWMDWAWAPGHFSGRVRVCENCGKVVKRDNKPGPLLQRKFTNPPRPATKEEMDKIEQLMGE